jgi:hypothetical protein
MIVIPVLLVKNEEYWIRQVVAPLVKAFGHAVVTDTGSTDDTVALLKDMEGVILNTYTNLSPLEMGQCRAWMQADAKILFGATHILLVDGDELYPSKYLDFIKQYPMPDNAISGFTSGVECTELLNGECWKLGRPTGDLVMLNRQAIISVESKWKGKYPFESPDTYVPGDPTNYYWKSPDASYCFYHIHQMTRSSRDMEVYLREEKKYQFSLQDAPEIKPAEFWLRSREDYKDE